MKERYLIGGNRSEGIVNWGAFIGQGAPRFYLSYSPEQASSNYAIMIVNTNSREVIDRIIPELDEFCTDRFPDLTPTIRPLQLGPPIEAPVQVRVSGEERDRLFTLVEKVKSRLAGISGTKNIDDDWGARTPKLLVNIDGPRARRAGVSNQDIAVSLQTMLTGFEITEYREEDEVIPVTLRSVMADREDIGKIESLNVYSQATGRSVHLKQVADAELVWEASKILRRNRLKTGTVSAFLDPGFTTPGVVGELEEWLSTESRDWGVGYSYEYGGEIETSVKSSQAIADKLPIAALIIVLLLVGQFNSIRLPIIILLTIPLGIIGVVCGLLIAGSYFGFMTLLGVISLSGIVINNAIVLLDRIKIEIEENGQEPARAVVEGAQRRLRPILLTTMTTMGGLIPLWLGGGPMWEPMAIAIIFGLLFATLLTLGVVPVLYSIFFRVKFKDFVY
jgi:multidrug efflux pump subunit AcrB